MDLIFSARSVQEQAPQYTPLHAKGLRATVEWAGGRGVPGDAKICRIEVANQAKTPWCGVIAVEAQYEKIDPQFFMPSFLYGRNRGEAPQNVPNAFPRVREQESFPSSPSWMVCANRLSHPAVLLYDAGHLRGFHASPYFCTADGEKKQWQPGSSGAFAQFAGYSCNLMAGENGTRCAVGYTLGYENAPWLFIKSHEVKPRPPIEKQSFCLAPGEKVRFTMHFYDWEVPDETGVYCTLEDVYGFYHEPPRGKSTPQQAVADIAQAICRDAWLDEEQCYSGFAYDDGRFNKLLSLSWTNGLSVAVPMLLAAHRLQDEKMRAQALQCIETLTENVINPDSGLPYDGWQDGKRSVRGWWFDGMHTPGHSGYMMGQAVYYLLKAYLCEGENKHPEWLELAAKILPVFERNKNGAGEYPYVFSEKDGTGLEYDALGSVWCLAAGALYSKMTGDKSALDGMKQSELHYYTAFVQRAVCYGGPMDTDKAVDSEGILAYLRAVRYLHEVTGAACYLDHMRHAMDYLFSFNFCYNVPIFTPPLSKLGWSSSGGCVTSVANPHIHPMAVTVLGELHYYLTQRDDGYVAARLADLRGWACQTYNTADGEYDYGKRGWMSERFCFCEGLLSEKYPDGSPASTWFCLMPWAGASLLEGLTEE